MDRPDDGDGPPKRRAVEAAESSLDPRPVQWRPSDRLNGNQLRSKGTEELVEIIQDMQLSFDNKFAALNARHDALNHEVKNLKKCIDVYFVHQNAAANAAGEILRTPYAHPADNYISHHASFPPLVPNHVPGPIPPRLTSPQQPLSMASPFAPSASYSNQRPSSRGADIVSPAAYPPFPRPGIFAEKRDYTPSKPPAGVPTPTQDIAAFSPAPTPSTDNSPLNNKLAAKLQVIPAEEEGKPPTVIYSTAPDITTIWREYRYGVDGTPSLESLEKEWGSTWRPDPRGRTWYSRRKLVQDKIKEYLHDGLSEDAAIAELEQMRGATSMNNLMNILQKGRKETKAGWKAAATAAKAAKDASKGRVG